MPALTAALTTALLSILGKLAGAQFLEAVLSHVIVWAGEKLAASTDNDIDDAIVAEIRSRLKPAATGE